MTKKNIIIGVLILFCLALTFLMPLLAAGAAIAVWIYLVWMVRKKKAGLFDDRMEPTAAERRLKTLKTSLWAAGISFVVFIAGFILHNAVYGVSETEEPVSFFIAMAFIVLFVMATISSLIIFLKGRIKSI